MGSFFGVCPKGAKPRLFLLICCLVSILIGLVSTVFLYFPHNEHLQTFGITAEEEDISSEKFKINEEDSLLMSTVTNSEIGSSNSPIQLQSEKLKKIRTSSHQNEKQIISWNLTNNFQASNFSNVIENRLIHFDFKGSPPKLSYLKETIRLAKIAGITGILLEWEDTFPWTENLANLTLTRGGYSLTDVKELIQFVESEGLEVIPLVQSFGHTEFILKGTDFAHLREVEGEPQSFCPSRIETIELIEEMIEQIITVHQNSRYIHIGCDEVFNLRLCPLCTEKSENGDELFLRHVSNVAQIVRKFGKIPLLWDDMLRSIPEKQLYDSKLGSLVEIMIWVYAEEIDRYVGFDSWEKYSKVFPTIWVAGSYKGTSGETTQIPIFSRHVNNIERWIEVIIRESSRWGKGLGGFVLTGWSRYDHFAVLCELLPSAIPSLIYSVLEVTIPNTNTGPTIRNRIFLTSTVHSHINPRDDQSNQRQKRSGSRRWVPHPQTLRKMKPKDDRRGVLPLIPESKNENQFVSGVVEKHEKVWKEFTKILVCPFDGTRFGKLLKETNDTELSFAGRCNWTGVNFFRSLFYLRSLLVEVAEVQDQIKWKRGWLTDYNINHNYTLPLRIVELIRTEIPRLKENLALKAKSIGISLKSFYRNEVILEWIEQNIWNSWKAVDQLERAGEKLKKFKYWERRPLRTSSQIVSDLRLHPLHLINKNEL